MKKVLLVTLILLAAHQQISAQQAQANDPIAKAFFPPELVMQNQEVIGLSEVQKTNISKEMQAAQTDFMSLQWDLTKESEKLTLLVNKDKPSEQDALAQIEKVLSIENRIKKRQITLLIRIKNLLTAEQQGKLQQLKVK